VRLLASTGPCCVRSSVFVWCSRLRALPERGCLRWRSDTRLSSSGYGAGRCWTLRREGPEGADGPAGGIASARHDGESEPLRAGRTRRIRSTAGDRRCGDAAVLHGLLVFRAGRARGHGRDCRPHAFSRIRRLHLAEALARHAPLRCGDGTPVTGQHAEVAHMSVLPEEWVLEHTILGVDGANDLAVIVDRAGRAV
jgi:hypothetical protein